MAQRMAPLSAHGNADLGALYARVSERVESQGKDIGDLRSNMNTGFVNVNAAITQLANETRTQIASLANSFNERNKTPWGVLISAGLFFLAIVIAVGGLAYQPIREATTDLKTSVRLLEQGSVTREELDWRSQRTAEDRIRTEMGLKDLRETMLPRNEWAERNLNRDHDIENIRSTIEREVTDLQRQIDLQRGDFSTFANSLGNGRDVITNLQAELTRLRDQVIELRRSGYAQPVR